MQIMQPERIKKVLLPGDLPGFVEKNKHGWVTEEKLDGARYNLYIGDKGCKLLSRRISDVTGSNVDKTANCPHITEYSYDRSLAGTILDGEITFRENCSTAIKIMGCGADKAVERQKDWGWVEYNVFDVLMFRGEDVRSQPLNFRRSILHIISQSSPIPKHLKIVEQGSLQSAVSMYNSIINSGGEGIVLKNLYAGYGKQWIKVKKCITCDVIITGFREGAGKYSGMVGSIVFSIYRGDHLVEIGTCSGMTDEMRDDLDCDRASYLNTVMEVAGQEFTKDFALRHPRFIRLRPDKSPTDCKWSEQINIRGALIDEG